MQVKKLELKLHNLPNLYNTPQSPRNPMEVNVLNKTKGAPKKAILKAVETILSDIKTIRDKLA